MDPENDEVVTALRDALARIDKVVATTAEVIAENERLGEESERLAAELDLRVAEVDSLRRLVAEFEERLESAQRAGKRQAAPFSKGEPSSAPRRPGRRSGEAYGKAAHRPPPDHVDETVVVELPGLCPHCLGPLEECGSAEQFQEEMPVPRPVVTHFIIAIGRCQRCGRRVQGRHPRQTSDALGAAAAQLGPTATGLACLLTKRLGLSAVKACQVLAQTGGIDITAGGLVQATQRVADRAKPTYEALRESVRRSPMVSPDETGWRVGGRNAWLWDFVTPEQTVYAIRRGRGYAEAAEILGSDYAGILVRDGWAPYRRFSKATHQTCAAHLLRRCHAMLEGARGRAREIPRAVQRLLLDALEVRDRRDRGAIEPTAVAEAVAELEQRLHRLLSRPAITKPANRRLLKHLGNEQGALFTFLKFDGVDATNWRSEQGVRPAVVNRKVWGGNRTEVGARTQEVLMSVMQTCHQQKVDIVRTLADLQRARIPSPAPLRYASAAP